MIADDRVKGPVVQCALLARVIVSRATITRPVRQTDLERAFDVPPPDTGRLLDG